MVDTLNRLGYILKRNVTDVMGVKHKYGLYPTNGGGINYFDSTEELRRFQLKVQVKRAWEEKYPLNLDSLIGD